ncbi:MAG: response regulator [Candidatus Odinarchaeota archaeon]
MRGLLTVLHVDDDLAFLELTQKCLEKKVGSINLTSVSDPFQALQLLENYDFDAVICDYQMPVMNGLELLEDLRSRGNTVPFIILTGRGREEIAIQALNLGADYYLQKSSSSTVLFTELMHFITKIAEKKQEQEKRERAEKALAFERNQLLAIFDSMDYQINVTDPITREVLYANKALERVLGNNPIGRKCHEVFQGLEQSCDPCTTVQALENGETTHQWDSYNSFLDRYYVVVDRLIRWPDGRNAWLELAVDVTNRKRVEVALRESEERFRKVFEEGPIGMAITGMDYLFIRANHKFCELLGYSEQELATMTFQTITHPAHVKKDLQQVERLFRREIPYYKTVKRYFRKNGDILWANVTVSLIRDNKGCPLNHLVMVEEKKRHPHSIRMVEKEG